MVQLVREVDIGEQETVFELVGELARWGNVDPTHGGMNVVLPPH